MNPKAWMHLEGAAVLMISIFFYAMYDFSWFVFAIFLLVPDISMVGYMKNTKSGATLYNIFHSYILPVLLVVIGFLFLYSFLIMIALIWIAHIGMDRMIGYGLKYPTAFKDTHLQRV
ncbi:MAG: DUF4260 domain-containing protein [Bacillota bacterium]|uniref:DUF4260 domain-containing protein n=1 Tax=Virgibacillus salarius TaxID=447199 RepID=A0A941DZT6_9BACI|nr:MULTISPECIES: DUF4260 domain-containing protein [Bacillaceae]NAZ09067.1 DUF4260 family protein [Agaribacter marinus]MBR7796358.1 DUF4260 domain-containing protein [Virgibacillus salarius]MCC2251836.1 DUF4260 domain-containing protein [Virgibacillus sp. AGTR]MDY7045470.1 DUF4260 domain-containing protein [Virgibacillus sp. M23]QRZ16315.1 DUF4260 domain-containing protein [Virgibacillus sp. AGTR]